MKRFIMNAARAALLLLLVPSVVLGQRRAIGRVITVTHGPDASFISVVN